MDSRQFKTANPQRHAFALVSLLSGDHEILRIVLTCQEFAISFRPPADFSADPYPRRGVSKIPDTAH
jgi:hypothetical protein